jgi:UDP-N-acetylglucosamine--N-acetylmuramyl-(pentapeptide) pyrophosphoryl-undecaprenol N-acetylglucosamine transferase
MGLKNRGNIIFTGGGTAGHVFPGLAVAKLLKQSWPCSIYWMGTRWGMEHSLIKEQGLPFISIPAGKLRRYLSFWNIVDLFSFLGGIVYSLIYLAAKRPLLLFSKGGFVSVPPVIAAKILGIPSITHESDYDPGLATKINSLFANKILISFSQSAGCFSHRKKKKIIHSGNPLRLSILKGNAHLGRSMLGCPPAKKLILVLGGSLGSLYINKLISALCEDLSQKYFIVHQTGKKNILPPKTLENYYPVPFLQDELPHVLAAADLVLSRAGANTLWELAATGKPSILIPLGKKRSRGDQLLNAQVFEKAGASIVFNEEGIKAQNLLATISDLLDNEAKLDKMGKAALKLGMPEATERIVSIILSTIKEKSVV